ncbi:MAG TPA: protein kinase [Thermoanaerobaculia bacterium]|nr:protein kinase [Thermoanaerobaculia bacterium]
MTLLPGRRLGPYEILALRGKGGMGEVYRARDSRLDREVAVKVLPAELVDTENLRERLHREARSASQLSHPHVCTVFDVGHVDGLDYLVMEYLEGETLWDRLRRGPMELDEALRSGAQIARGIAAAHRRNLVHRDLKPGNVMLTRGGAKVLDFGLAKATDRPGALTSDTQGATPPPQLTRTGAWVGTPHYMSPEQISGDPADARSDVFALGVVLYEMVTGRQPFGGANAAELIASVVSSQPKALRVHQPRASPRLQWVISRCLEKDPEERWQDSHDLALELEAIAAGTGDSSASRVASRALPQALAWLGAAAFAGLVLGLLLGRMVLGARVDAEAEDSRLATWTVTELELPLPRGFQGKSVALAPDGRSVAFVGEQPGRRQLFLRHLDSLESRPIPGTEGVETVYWFSPDAKALTYRQGRVLLSVTLQGGGGVLPLVDDGWNGRLAADGYLYFNRLRNMANREGTELWRMPAAGGESTLLGRGFVAGGPIPGTQLLLTHAPSAAGSRYWFEIELLDLESGRLSHIVEGVRPYFLAPDFLVFYRENTLWAARIDLSRSELASEPRPVETSVRSDLFVANDFGAFDLNERGDLLYRTVGQEGLAAVVWVGIDGRRLGEAAPERRGFETPSLSFDGRFVGLSVRNANGSTERWLLELESASWTRPAQAGRINSRQLWTNHGRETVFTSNREGFLRAYVQSADGSGQPTPLLDLDDGHVLLDLSPDGRYVLYSPMSTRGLRVYDRVSDTTRTLESSAWILSACMHPSGRWVFYAAAVDAANTSSEIWLQPYPEPGEPRQVSRGGAQEVRCSHDGRQIYYRTPTHFVAQPLADESGALRTGRPVTLFEDRFLHTQVDGLTNYAVHSDGRFLVLELTAQEDQGGVVLIQNWVAKLRRIFEENRAASIQP